jgi:hypothetical protein
MPLLDTVFERFMTASQDFADQDLAAIYELDRPAKSQSDPRALSVGRPLSGPEIGSRAGSEQPAVQ